MTASAVPGHPSVRFSLSMRLRSAYSGGIGLYYLPVSLLPMPVPPTFNNEIC